MKLHQIFSDQNSPTNTTIIEINLISAQNLPSRHKSSYLRTYVVVYVDPKQKLISRLDQTGDSNPTWNDKFVFTINSDFAYRRPNACIVFEIYRARRIKRDKKIGVVNVLLESLVPIKDGDGTCMAFNVRTFAKNEIAQGILNIGVMRLDSMFNLSPMFHGSRGVMAVDYRRMTGKKN